MQTEELISVREYLTTAYDPDCDYVDGVVEERNLGERDHAKLQGAVFAYFYNRRKEWGIHVFPEQRVQVSATRFRVPDVCVVAGPEPQEQILQRASVHLHRNSFAGRQALQDPGTRGRLP